MSEELELEDLKGVGSKTDKKLDEEGLAEGAFAPDFEGQIFSESCPTRVGMVQHDRVRGLLASAE